MVSMLEHQKIVLANLGDNKTQFRKELHKSIDWLSQDELIELWHWLNNYFWESHNDIIVEAFTFARV